MNYSFHFQPPNFLLKPIFILLLLLTLQVEISAQTPQITAYPPHWWAGMNHHTVQILLHSPQNLQNGTISINYPGVTITKIHPFSNPNFSAIDVVIDPTTQPGSCPITITVGKKKQILHWPIKKRDQSPVGQGVTSADLVYLLMPDRFSNGDPTNDKVKGLKDQSLDRDSLFHRHGGDLKGVTNHLNYLQDLGVTALWMTPVLKNDMPHRTEHGYAFTDHYSIDPRLGGESAYKELSNALHARGMKLIQDAVYNHVGSHHFLFTNPPDQTWFHQWPTYTNTTYKDQAQFDAYAAESDKKQLVDGWFTRQMPDLNQSNPYVATFLIQHALWCVEEFRVDGWRIDTYLYNDLAFMNRCNDALLQEYPHITLFGETWVHGVVNQAYFTRNNMVLPFKSNLPGVTDFQTNLYGIQHAVNEDFGWTNGVNRLWQTISNDIVYEDPNKLVIFLDNHDLSRFFSITGENIAKQKMGLAWLLTCRGIPQLYYGTEINMKGFTNPDGWVRLDFPGGWAGDPKNKFNAAGRTPEEEETFTWTRNLARFRLTSDALKHGRYVHFVPEQGVYVYFRIADNQVVMCIMNSNKEATTVDLSRFRATMGNTEMGFEPTTGKRIPLKESLVVPSKYVMVLELGKN